MTIGIAVFPGSNCDRDVQWAAEGCLGIPTRFLWHEERDLRGLDAVVLPGGFSYGDYLRCGALARFAPLLEEVVAFVARGGPVLGICNGFQVLTEIGLLPGALTRNQQLHFLCEPAELTVQPGSCRWLQGYGAGETISLPIAHGEGRYQVDDATLARLEQEGQVALRYRRNPNGSVGDVAGLSNAAGNVLGLMPHPERACDPVTGGLDGRRLLASLLG
ncbi:phosphoribosylformylglycinamidine synthase subunit PurQ [Synechococcus sp. CS-1324]|uniref:phosphoribosylformylglycinamidine synthase subunit PurQ n=1 Tax=unclassified Synechococcus TaxID=2626047 RepID=UPI000DB09DF2|nr:MULTISPECIES: phosphoribosylformylglycinamidine synthase subunit PurQ [unclassified Synechococcus]MCT0212129.1 phosphoribosylformylglycinamidine synthase subunit PurQ [Synechococcus sp. CS-1326]MCT0229435.1 phosphoribosylformylglycinamidine synthase subunit PurQ [Synechococcus sp. CS-1324]MCT0232917.1 phosphoribosylformylglycinamidine synthase subunit PurQ [Synechococcus sp. CS-1327]PZV04952.1 MAG: phosphoribosylformylglycinamidine synthase subunit PurQ [Cyanobium sp.]